MADLPTGTVTMLFTDIEGSTSLLHRLTADRYAGVLTLQRELLRTAFTAEQGVEMGTEGDSFFVVFASATACVRAALAAQLALATTAWPDGASVRVRMGVHTGEPRRHEDGYVGMDVHRAARVASCAHGGQVVVSAATHQLVEGALPDDVRLLDLGEHRLKDLPGSERLYQLAAPGLDDAFPPLRTLGARSNLPAQTSSLVGRDAELAEVADAVLSRDGRLTTLTGPGGSGKTRLALAVAERVEPLFPDGVYFVPLETARSADVMWSRLAETLGVSTDGVAGDAVVEHLAGARTLLVLDNLEQLDDAPKVVDRLLREATGCRVVATSRRPLHLDGEQEHAVPPLTLPRRRARSVSDVAGAGAVSLFVQRARLVRPDFALDASNAADVAAICRRLDGLPLAVEIAAARLKLLGVAAVRSRLDDGLDLPQSKRAAGPKRQQTLASTIAWSYELLP
ncbi:adenylate/guanylate cyclase domain-containing protein, partial [Angustibacter peucedani]